MLDVDQHGDQYPPSRPGVKTLLAILLVVLVGLAIAFGPQIMGAMGIHATPPAAGN
jgi:hypothetical protein